MHKTVLIILAAVVALIVIVVLTGLRYLRADDDDDFDDESAAERGQSRGRGAHPARDHWRSRHHDDDRHGDAHRQRSHADREAAGRSTSRERGDRERSEHAVFAGVSAARRGSGRSDSSGAGFGLTAGRAGGGRRDGSIRDDADRVRTGRDNVGRDSAGIRSGDRRGPNRDGAFRDLPGRDVAARSGGERGWHDAGRDDRRNSGPGRRVTGSRNYDNDSADELMPTSTTSSRGSAGRGGIRPDDFDDRTARMSGRDSSRDYPRGQDLGTDGTNPGRDDRSRDDRERRSGSGQNASADSRRTATSQSRKDDSLPDVKPRPGKSSQSKSSQSKSKRDGDGDWPSTEWDELSDVDYWAELASDKPFTSAAPSTTPPSRSDRDRADTRSATDSGPVRAVDRRDSPGRRDSADRRDSLDRRSRDTADRRDGTERRDLPLPAARATRQPVDAAFTPPATSDPTDHAFGARTDAYGSTELRRAIASGRSSTSGQPRMSQLGDDDPLTSPSFPQISDDGRSYRRSGGRGQGEGESHSQTRPYSTYPSAPPHPQVGPLDSQPGPSRTTGGYSQPATSGIEYAAAPPVTSSYPVPPPAAPAASYPTDSVSNVYSAPTAATSSYPAGSYPTDYEGTESPTYQPPPSVPSSASLPATSLPAEYDSGYGAVAAVGTGYSPAPTAASYPVQPAEQPEYSNYPNIGQPPAAQPQSTGFSYSQPADPGFVGQSPAGQQTDSYLGYEPPLHTGQAGVYQLPAPGMLPPQSVQPGYPSAPYNAAPYEPPAYPAPTRAYEVENGYPADPYAVDPYGYPGYGSARLSEQRWRGQPLSDQRWNERSRQEQAWDDRSGTVQHRYQQYWEDDDR